jgi:hypothetical protein
MIAPRYFETVGVRLIRGRDFTAADRDGAPRVVIVNEAMSRRFWPGASPLGKRVQFGGGVWAEIIGVAEDLVSRRRAVASALVYRNFLQSSSDNSDMTLLLRFRGDPTALVADLRRATKAIDPGYAAVADDAVGGGGNGHAALAYRRFHCPGFGMLGLALAALGIYGLVAYTVSQRTREIGVRMALSAGAGDIRRLVVGHGVSWPRSGSPSVLRSVGRDACVGGVAVRRQCIGPGHVPGHGSGAGGGDASRELHPCPRRHEDRSAGGPAARLTTWMWDVGSEINCQPDCH